MSQEYEIQAGDTVWTLEQHYFLEGINPNTGEEVELKLPKKDQLKVIEVHDDGTLTCQVVGGHHVVLRIDEVEGA